jgi:TonB-linked SusC/RagA family outer membrane protein
MKHLLLSFSLTLLLTQYSFAHKNNLPAISIYPTALSDTTSISDSVNLGYRYVRRHQLTSAVSSISQKQLQHVAVFSVDQALKGLAAGIQVTQNSGAPGAAASVRVRGMATIFNSAEPLYVLDGVPLAQTAPNNLHQFLPVLNFINLADIASVEILKDAGAAAIYGNRATNGVVLITTKRGQAKANQVSFHSSVGLQQVPKQMNMLNATEYAGLVNEARQQNGQAPQYTPEQLQTLGKGTNWQNEIFRVAPVHQHQLNYSGGSAAHRIFASAHYLNQQGVILESGLKRYSFRLNYDGQIGRKLKVGVSSFISTAKNQPTYQLLTLEALTAPPVLKPGDPAARYISPLLTLQNQTSSENGKLLWGNIFAEYSILPGLFLKAHYGVNTSNQKNHSIFISYSPLDSTQITSKTKKYTTVTTTLKEITLRFSKQWQSHSVAIMSGFSSQDFIKSNKEERSISLDMGNLPNWGTDWYKYNLGWIAYFGSLQYSFADRYFVSASLRKDGSPYFSPAQKYALAPVVAAAWQIIPLNGSDRLVSGLKLRASYGKTANAYFPSTHFSTNIFINQDLTPEKTRQVNVGADVTLKANRIQLSADIYQRKTVDGMLIIPIPNSYHLKNAASVRNQGLEISLSSTNLKGPFTWESSFAFAANQNKVTGLGAERSVIYNNRDVSFIITEGSPVGTFFGYKTDGLYQNQSEITDRQSLGDIKIRDLNNNGSIYDDRTTIGSAQPKFIYSIDNTFNFKNFELNIFLQGVQGNKIYHASRSALDNFYLSGEGLPRNSSRKTLNHWTTNRTHTNIPRLNNFIYNSLPSDYYVENGSFLRLRNLTLGYNLPQKLTVRNKMLQAKVYVSGQNLLTFTQYTGYDPELGSPQPTEQGYDAYNYPIPRTYLAGLQITW